MKTFVTYGAELEVRGTGHSTLVTPPNRLNNKQVLKIRSYVMK